MRTVRHALLGTGILLASGTSLVAGQRVESAPRDSRRLVRGDTATGLVAQGSFVFNQSLAGIFLYAPAVAVTLYEQRQWPFTISPTIVGTILIADHIADHGPITRAQNALATDGMWRGALLLHSLRHGYSARRRECFDFCPAGYSSGLRTEGLAVLTGGVIGSIVGFSVGRSFTSAEAAGMTVGANVAAAMTLGVMKTTNPSGATLSRSGANAFVLASLAGYPLGLNYVRRAPYSITAGDVSAVLTSGMFGVLASSALAPTINLEERSDAAILTAGLVTGLITGDRFLARRLDLTDSEAKALRLGAMVGAVLGIGATPHHDSRAARAKATLGAVAGMVFITTQWLPKYAGPRPHPPPH